MVGLEMSEYLGMDAGWDCRSHLGMFLFCLPACTVLSFTMPSFLLFSPLVGLYLWLAVDIGWEYGMLVCAIGLLPS